MNAPRHIPVFVDGHFVRFVTRRQHAAEVAGKVLAPVADKWRTATRSDRGWHATYITPSVEQASNPRVAHG